MELAEKGGRLVDSEQVGEWWAHIVTNAKQRLLAIPTRAAPLVLGCKSLPEVKDEIDKLIREALSELATTNPLPSAGRRKRAR